MEKPKCTCVKEVEEATMTEDELVEILCEIRCEIFNKAQEEFRNGSIDKALECDQTLKEIDKLRSKIHLQFVLKQM